MRKSSTNVVSLTDARPQHGGPGRPPHALDTLLRGLDDAARAAALSSDEDLRDAVRYLADAVKERVFAIGPDARSDPEERARDVQRESDAKQRLKELAELARKRTRRATRGRRGGGPADLVPDSPTEPAHVVADLVVLATGVADAEMVEALAAYLREHGPRVLKHNPPPDLRRRLRKILAASKSPSKPANRVRCLLGTQAFGLSREAAVSLTRGV